MTLKVEQNSRPTSREGNRSRHGSGNDASRSRHNSGKADLSPIIVTVDLLNEPIGDNETTLLMVAAKEGHSKLIQVLMRTGANPAIK